jgi:DNA-binding CsgD family transcriptional regulator
MSIDDQDNTRPDPSPSDWTWTPTPAAAKPNRATYEASRRAELDRIRRIDIKRRQLLGYFYPLGIHEVDDLWDRDDPSQQDREEHDKAAHELHMSHRVLVHAVEGYLLGCVRYPVLTAEAALRPATSTDSLIDLLQAEEDLMIRIFGPPRVEPPVTLNRSRLNGLQSPRSREVALTGVCDIGHFSTVELALEVEVGKSESACSPGCRVCFLAQKYGLTPREVTLIALISSGKSGRAISQTLGIGMPTIRQYCGRIHGKIGTHSRLAICLWAIREGMVKSAVQPKSGSPCAGSFIRGSPP